MSRHPVRPRAACGAALAALTTAALALTPADGASAAGTHAGDSSGIALCEPDAKSVGESVIMNNIWGARTAQCITVAGEEWEVTTSEHHNRGPHAAAYPATFYGCHWGGICSNQILTLPVPVYQVSSAPATWSFTGADAAGTWSAAFDLWFHTDSQLRRPPDGAEISIWLDRAGNADPPGRAIAQHVPLLGTTWHLYLANRPSAPVLTYVRATPTQQVTDFDLYAFVNDAEHRGHIDPTWTWSAAEAGFMLWRGGIGLRSHAFEFSTQDDPDRSDFLPLPRLPPPPGEPLPHYCYFVFWDLRRWIDGYVIHPIQVVTGSDVLSYTVTFVVPPGQEIEGWWNADLTFEGDTATVRPLTYQGPDGERQVSTFGIRASAPPPPIDNPLDIPYPRQMLCDPEFSGAGTAPSHWR